MISAEFAPNETKEDALFALQLLVQPWKWKKGKDITKLRQRLRRRFFSDKNEIIFFLTGRSALYYYLKSLQLPKNSHILVQAFTCEAVILPILSLGCTPIYIDINENDLSMNPEDLKTKYSNKAQVLILQHTFGITPTRRKQILAFAKEKKLAVLEDLAHGFDTMLFNSKSANSSLLLSFGRSKSISGVFGGAVVTKNKKISDYLTDIEKTLSYPSTVFMAKMALYKAITVPIKATYDIFIGKLLHKSAMYLNLLLPEISRKEKRGEFDTVFSKAMPNITALFIIQQLNRFNDVLKKKKEISKYYADKLRQSKEYSNAYLRYPYLSKNRTTLLKKGKDSNIFFGKWYDQVIAPKALELSKTMYKKGSCPVAEQISNEIVNLPTNVTKKQAQRIVKVIKSI